MQKTAVFILALALFTTPATAGTITFLATDGGELSVSFGQLPFNLSSDAEGDTGNGSISLVSGPRTAFTSGNGFSSYRYDAGTLTLNLHVFNSNGPDVDGTFTAPTLPFWIDVTEPEECEGEDEDGEPLPCDDDFEPYADDFFIELGPGLFDAEVAKVLGLAPETLGGSMLFGLESILGSAGDRSRIGYDHRGFADLDITTQEAPEPGLLALGLLSGAGWLARRRARSR